MNHARKKYYIILAIKKDNPNDVLGMCEHPFCMSWQSDRVHLWDIEAYCGKPTRYLLNEMVKQLEKSEYGKHQMELQNLKGKKTMLRKLYSNHAYKNFHSCGRSRAEYEWNWVKHYSMWLGKHLRKKDYDIRPYRVGSKFCPVDVDFKERALIDKGELQFDKYKWRNPTFKIKIV